MNLRSYEDYEFLPPHRAGYLIHLGLILLLIGGGALGLYRASQAQIGPVFLLSLLPGLVAVIFVPMLTYRLYCLRTAYYVLERDGLRLRWGLRIVHIPMTAVIWVHTQDELVTPLPMPWLRIPGSVVGVRQLSGATWQTGPKTVEYLASEARGLVLIGTEERIYAISPAGAGEFLYVFQRFLELGSLTPLPARSVYPGFLLNRVWNTLPARILILSGLALSIALFVRVGLAIPGREQVHLGFYPDSSPGDLAPALQLLLLPILNGLIVLVDLLFGFFFFRREETQYLSYLLWGCSVFITLLFLTGAYFILRLA
jgi:hypothetical protein